MGRKRGREASLKVFSGREASLNLIIFLILYPKGKLLASYDIFKEVRATKGYRHKGKQNVDRRVKALYKQHWLEIGGMRLSRPSVTSLQVKRTRKSSLGTEQKRQ